MSKKKQTWRLIVKKTGEVIIRSHQLDENGNSIKKKSLKIIETEDDSRHSIQYFENDSIVSTEDLTDYFRL